MIMFLITIFKKDIGGIANMGLGKSVYVVLHRH